VRELDPPGRRAAVQHDPVPLPMKALVDFAHAPVFGIPMIDGVGVREGMLLEGPQGWGEFSPPADADHGADARWLTAAIEGGTVGWPDPVRGRIPIAVTVPAVGAAAARDIVARSGCRTADVTVAAAHDALVDDLARVAAVRDALGRDGRIRLDAHGGWGVDTAVSAIAELTRAAGVLEFVGNPCRTADEVAAVRRRVEVRIAADVSVAIADVAILRCGPMGGVRRAMRLAEACGLPCVVSSSLETSIGLTSGLALAGALPELPFACALDTMALLTGDVVANRRSLIPVDGHLPVAPMPASPDPEQVERYAIADVDRITWWRHRLGSAQRAA
jgi:O-succinylbenzoate synthase